MLSNVAAGQTAAEDGVYLKSQVRCDNRFFSNQHEKQRDLDCKGDNISCVSGADNPSMMVGNHSGDIDWKNVSSSSVSVNSSLLEGFAEAVKVKPVSYFLAGGHYEVEERCNFSNRPVKFTEKPLHGNGPFSDKSEPSEISSLRDVYAGASSLKGDTSDCSMDQVESSFVRLASVTVEGHKHDAVDSSESVKFNFKEDLVTKAVKCSDQREDFGSHKVPSVQEPPLQSQHVECHDEPDLAVDVKVCDICGDTGREDLLAICSKCGDGAEHVYCMRVKLDKVPGGNWMCEDCMLLEEIEKLKRNKLKNVIGNSKGSSLDEICQNAGTSSTANIKSGLDLDIEGSKVEESRRDKVSLVPQFSAKRPAGNLDSLSATKRRAPETSIGSQRVSSLSGKALLSQDSPLKSTHDRPSSSDPSLNGILGNACLPTIPGHNSSKFRSPLPMLRGTLSKSTSFNISDSKLKVQHREELLQKQKISRETTISGKKTDATFRMIDKSLSYSSSGRPYMADSKIKMLSSSFSHVEDLKRLKHAKGNNSIQRKYACKLDKPCVSSSMANTCVSASENDKRFASNGDSASVHSFVNESLNLKVVPHSRNSITSSKPAFNLAHEGSKYPDDPAGTGVVKRQQSCFSDVIRDSSSPIMSNTSHELKPKGKLRSSSSLPTNRYCGSTGAIVLGKFSVSRESCNQDEKAQEASYFNWFGEQISARSKSLRCNKCNDMGHAAECCPIVSPRTSVPDGGIQKHLDHSSQVDLGFRFCNQPDASWVLAVPSLEFIWKGEFTMQNTGRLPSFCHGIQAHLSTRASPEVAEVVKMFPRKVLLEEVPRLSTWPTQFLGTNPKEDRIGLYFFAEDFESYGRNYKSLLDCMINYDLALKGNIDGIELLIFSSNLLSEKSQRWNKLFFLWGVFRGRRVNNTQCMPKSQKKTSIPSLHDVISDQDLSIPAVSRFQNTYSSGPSSECLTAFKLSYIVQPSSNSINPQESPSVSSGRKDENHELKLSSPETKYFYLQTTFDQKPSRDDSLLSCFPVGKEQLCRDMQHTSTSQNEHGVVERKQDTNFQSCLQESSECNMDYVQWTGDGAYNMTMTENSRTKSPISPGPDPAVDAVLGVKSSQWQLCSSNHENHWESECLDLDLSLGDAKKSAKQGVLPVFLGNVDKNNQDKNRNILESNINNDSGSDEFSASLNLSLGLRSYDK